MPIWTGLALLCKAWTRSGSYVPVHPAYGICNRRCLDRQHRAVALAGTALIIASSPWAGQCSYLEHTDCNAIACTCTMKRAHVIHGRMGSCTWMTWRVHCQIRAHLTFTALYPSKLSCLCARRISRTAEAHDDSPAPMIHGRGSATALEDCSTY